ncbi:MAG: glucose-6-phosphate isomerase family protein [Nanoarchaeota archaeon]
MNYNKTIREFENNYDKKEIIKLRDMKNRFKDESNFDDNSIIYDVYIKKLSPIQLGLTVINPGAINEEFYMTRGHVHSNRTPEFYILLEGSGVLVMQKNNKAQRVNLKKGEITLIPEGYAHRLVNVGKKKLKALTVYQEDSMPNYNIKFKKRFLKR